MRAPVIALALLAATAGGCTNFPDETTVVDLRLLAMQADPPEFLLDPAMPPMQIPGPSHIRALVGDPKGGGRDVHFRAVACPNDAAATEDGGGNGPGGARQSVNRGACPDDAEIIAEGDAQPDAIAFDFTPSPTLAMAAIAADPLGRLFGLPITIELRLAAGMESVIADKRVVYAQRLRDDQKPNANPFITRITNYARRGDEKVVLEPGVAREVTLGSELFIEPDLEEARTQAVAEAYPQRVLDRKTMTLTVKEIPKETLRYAFYATAGRFALRQTLSEPSPIFMQTEAHLESKWIAPKVMPEDPTVTIFIVVRDERAGSGWTTRTLRIVAP